MNRGRSVLLIVAGAAAGVLVTLALLPVSERRADAVSPPAAVEAPQPHGDASLTAVEALADAPPELEPGRPVPPPDGSFRVRDIQEFSLPGGDRHLGLSGVPDFGARFDELVARATSGDLDGALSLAGGLMACGLHFRRVNQIGNAMSPARIWASDDERERTLSGIEREMASDTFAALERNCAGVTLEMTRQSFDWFRRAAELGDALATHNYAQASQELMADLATDPPRLMQFRESASRLTHRDARRCIANAFMNLSNAYRYGTFETRDPVRSVANLILFQWTLGAADSFERMSRGFPGLTELQYRQAVDLASRMYRAYCAA